MIYAKICTKRCADDQMVIYLWRFLPPLATLISPLRPRGTKPFAQSGNPWNSYCLDFVGWVLAGPAH